MSKHLLVTYTFPNKDLANSFIKLEYKKFKSIFIPECDENNVSHIRVDFNEIGKLSSILANKYIDPRIDMYVSDGTVEEYVNECADMGRGISKKEYDRYLENKNKDFDNCPKCKNKTLEAKFSGVKCINCNYWFCY